MSLATMLAFEAHQEIEREYCWYVTLDQDPVALIEQLKGQYDATLHVQASIKSNSGSIRVRSEQSGNDGEVAITSTVKEYLANNGDDIQSSKETTITVDLDYFKAFVGMVGEAMYKIRFKIPYTDKEGSFWEVDIFTDGNFKPTIYAKIDLETSMTIDDSTVQLPVSGTVTPASPENKAVTSELLKRIMVKSKDSIK